MLALLGAVMTEFKHTFIQVKDLDPHLTSQAAAGWILVQCLFLLANPRETVDRESEPQLMCIFKKETV